VNRRLRSGHNAWLPSILAAGLLFSNIASAASVCFPPGGGGVPGQPGLPDWWTGTAPFDDPRWLGSYGFGDGAVKFTAMVETTAGQKFLLLKWHVRPDPGPAGLGDQIFVGFYNPTTTVGTILKLTRDANVTTAGGTVGAGVMSASAFTRTGTSGLWASVSPPADISAKARLDATCTTGAPIFCDDWAIRLRVPTSAAAGGVDLGDTFDMWYELDVEHSGTSDRAKFPIGALPQDDTAAPVVFPEPLGSVSPPSEAWNSVKIAGAGACVAGVDIQSSDISVANAIGAGTEVDVNSANTFHAKPINNTTGAFNPNSIKARFRIADWGSFVGDSPRWITVPDPSCENATGAGAPGTITAGTRFDLTCAWTLTAGQKCAYRPDLFPGCTPDPGPRYAHQCVMTELSSNGTPVPFSTDSSWNNFNFGHSSKLEQKARIDIGNLGPRDVYLYVMLQNMPDKVAPAPAPATGSSPAAGDKQPPPTVAVPPALRERIGPIVPGRVGEKDAALLRTLVANGRITYDDVAKVMPTYAVYVWHDTGKTVKSPSGTSKLLAPQPSFTLFVSHDGPLVGWKQALTGVGGATVTEISKNFFRVAVGAPGSVEVLTSVEALETDQPPPGPKPSHGIPIWLTMVIMVVVLIIVMVRRSLRRRAGP
jgi:hypothetical protein